jgi:4-amino-4-deoxy-L-arabinose transferase-like glycosyltransferase
MDPLIGCISIMTDVVDAPVRISPKSDTNEKISLLRRLGAILVGGLLACGCLVVQVRWLLTPYPADQIHYLQAARDFPSQPPGPFDHQYLRYGLIAPIRVAIEVFGYSQAAYYAVPVASGTLLLVSTYALGTMWFGRVVGVLAALLMLGNSAVFALLSTPMPDIPATACIVSAIALAAAVRQRRPWAAGGRRRRAVVLVLIGLLLATGYLCREYVVAIWPLVALILFRRIPPREFGWLIAPIVGLVAAETWINAVVAGDPLARLHVDAAHGSASTHQGATFQNKSAWEYLARFPMGLYHAPEGRWLFGLLVATVAGGVAAALALRGPMRSTALGRDPRVRRLGLLLLWILLLWVPLTLLGGVLDPAQPKLRLQLMRYWFPVYPAVLLGGIAVAWLAGHAAARRIPAIRRKAGAVTVVAGMTAAAVALPPLFIAAESRADSPSYRVNGATQLEDFRAWLARHPEVRVIWTDGNTAKILPLFTSGPFGGKVWHGKIRGLRDPMPTPAADERVLLYNTDRGQYCRPCREAALILFGNPLTLPPTWTRDYETPDGVVQIYLVR